MYLYSKVFLLCSSNPEKHLQVCCHFYHHSQLKYGCIQPSVIIVFNYVLLMHINYKLLTYTGYVFVSLVLFVLARFDPYEWDNPYPCIEEPEELENQFSLANSFWFTIGSLMQQGSDVAPISLSTRLLAGMSNYK